jgi:hypothetical protein
MNHTMSHNQFISILLNHLFGTINTNVGHLLTFRPIQKISIKYISFFLRKDMYSKKNSIYYNNQLHIHFLKKSLLVMNMLVFNFQNMMNMEKRYEYQISNYVAYKKTYKKKAFVHQKT